MRRIISPAAALSVALVASGGLLIGALFVGTTTAGASTPPPWEPDGNSVGSLTFYNSSGTVITSGSTADPLAAYVAGSATIRTGDTKAELYGYLPVHTKVPGEWSGELLGADSTYPNAGAPSPLGAATTPVYTSVAGDESVADFVSDYPNTDTSSDGYAHLYQIRLLTSKAGRSVSATYDSADIQVIGSTWSLVYPSGSSVDTTTTLAVAPSSPTFGSKVKLTATVTPSAAAGSVTFLDGTKTLKTVKVAGGSASYSVALGGGKHTLAAAFVPSSGTYGTSTSANHSVTVKAASTSVDLKAAAKKVAAGKKLTLTALEAPATSGTVTFLNGSKKLGKAKVKKGKATFATTKLAKGKHTLTAKFAPKSSADYSTSTSKKVKVKVTG